MSHLGQLIGFPGILDRHGKAIDDPGQSNHQHPCEAHDAKEVVVIEPFGAGAAQRAQRAEIELAHERGIQDHARNQRDYESCPHRTQEQHPRDTQKHIGVQLEQEMHYRFHAAAAIFRYRPDQLSGRSIE